MTPTLLRGLEVLCAIVEEGSATAAARRLGLSQPAVSQQVARLEQRLSLALFARENGRLRPTVTALEIYAESRHAFDGLDRVLSLARDIHGLDRGQLRVAAPHSLAPDFLPTVLARLARGRPHLRIRVQHGTYEQITAQVAARRVDLGIAKAPMLTPGVEAIEIAASPLVALSAIGPARGRPQGRQRPVPPAVLAKEPLIMVGRGRPWREEIDVAFRRAGVAPQVRIETHTVQSACGLAAAGFGTAIAPEWLVGCLGRSDLLVRPLDFGIVHRFLAIYPAGARRDELAQDFALLCREIAAWRATGMAAAAEGPATEGPGAGGQDPRRAGAAAAVPDRGGEEQRGARTTPGLSLAAATPTKPAPSAPRA
ncbi:MAG: LysR family transcriptional regulator [Rhodobacteraceae bacterium]|nr:LysR family transcriptional regulator [Paracoccaceae bacterium]